MGAIRYVAGIEVRRRWRVMVALAVLVGVGGGAVLVLLAGARRADTSYDRYRAVTRAADVSVAPGEFDAEIFDAIEGLPQVADAVRPVFPFVVPEGSGLYPFLDFNAISYPRRADVRDVQQVDLVDGRLPDPDRRGEIAVVETYARRAGLAVGDRLRFESYAPDQFEDLFGTGDVGAPEGPTVRARVTAIVDAPDFLGEREAAFLPVVFFTPAFVARHAETIGMYPGGIDVRLRGGQADVPAFSRQVRALLPDDEELEIQPASDVIGRIDDSLRVLVVGLLLCAACAALTAIVATGFAVARELSRAPGDVATMRALGMTSPARIGTAVTTMLPVGVGGAALAVVLALGASPLMPVGIARQADPDLGVSFDGRVLGAGFVVITLAVVVITALASWRATAGSPRGDEPTGSPVPRAVRRVTPIKPPVARSLGVRLALDPGRGRNAVPVRAAALGAVLGVAGLTAAVVFAASLTATIDRPARYGFPWDAIVAGFQGDRAERVVDDLREDARVEDLGVLRTGIAVVGDRDMNVYAVQRIAGDPAMTIIAGRSVAGDDEVVLGAGTARALGVDLGDTVVVRGTGRRARMELVGIAALPLLDDRSSVDIGAVMTGARLRSVTAEDTINRDVLVGWAAGVDAREATRDLERAGAELFVARLPSDLDNLDRVRTLPWALAALLAVVALLALAHAVLTTVRRRRRDLAVLRTLGLVDRQLSALVRWESSTFAAIGVVVGIPLGAVAGALAWSTVADGIGVVSSATTPVGLLVVVALAAVVAALVTAAGPARRARRVQPASVLAVAD